MLLLSDLDGLHGLITGFQAVLHVHSVVEEIVLKGLICKVDRKTGKPDKEAGRPRFVKQVCNLVCTSDLV